MITYEFKCTKCNHVDEEMFSLKEYNELKEFRCTECNELSERFYGSAPQVRGWARWSYEQQKQVEYWRNDHKKAYDENDAIQRDWEKRAKREEAEING